MMQNRCTLISKLIDMQKEPNASGREVLVCGWVRTNRNNGHVGFIDLNDGSSFTGCQIVYDMDTDHSLKQASKISTGSAVEITGTYILTPEAKQPFEIHARAITLLSNCDTDYPMQKKTPLSGIFARNPALESTDQHLFCYVQGPFRRISRHP